MDTIVPGLWRVGGGTWNGVVPSLSVEGDCNIYLSSDDETVVLIDCGTLEGKESVEANLRELGQDPASVTDVLLTHSHWDHTEATALWQKQHGVRVHLNAIGAEFLARGDHRLVGYQLQGPEYAFTPFRVDHAVQDGQTFELGRSTVTAHFLPGHTPDSTLYTFRHGDQTLGICGDTAFAPNRNQTGPLGFLSSLWLSNLDDYVVSLGRLVQMPIDLLIPGHGNVVYGRERVRETVSDCLATAEFLASDQRVRGNLFV